MPIKVFTSGRIRKAEYDPASGQLDLHWDNKSILAYKQVPQEVYRRLCSAPEPGDILGGPDRGGVSEGHTDEVQRCSRWRQEVE